MRALSLRHSQINLNVDPRAVVFWDNTKNGKFRQVPLTKAAIGAIKAMPKASEYVFYHPESMTRWGTCRDPKRGRQRDIRGCGFNLSHAYGTRPAEKGVPMHFISEVMGHHSFDYTRKQYARFSPESASRAVLRVLEGGKIFTNLALEAA